MAHSIGKTIAELRKAKGWTQIELAEKLNVSDKAVSKWESEGGFPEITQLPVLAKIFDVSIDYLMTGKKEEPIITLDDMDSKKRMFYLIEHDDVDNYLKYGYEKVTYFNDFPINSSNKNDKTPILAIMENNSYKIFNACIRAGIKIKSNYTSNSLTEALYKSPGHFDMLIRFACMAGCVEFLDKIQFRTFAVGNKILNNRTNATYSHNYEERTAYLISERTIDTIFNNAKVPIDIIDYVCTYVPFDSKKVKYSTSVADYGRMDGRFYFLEQDIIEQLYRSQRYELLDKYLKAVAEDTLKTIELFNNLDRCEDGRYVRYSITPSSYLIRSDSGDYGYTTVKGKVITISSKIINLAISNLDKEYTEKFVQFNKTIANNIDIGGFVPFTPNESDLKVLFENAKREKRVMAIKDDKSITEHEKRCKLANEKALSLADVIVGDDYDAFILLDESERNKIDPEYLSRNGVQDVRFYIYAVNISDDVEHLNQGLKNILENYPERYDIQDILLSAGAIIDENIAMTNILKQNVLILNKQVGVDSGSIEVHENITKQELLEKVEANQLQYVIINATIQMERKLKAHILEQIDLSNMIDKALTMGLVDVFNCKLLHKLRMARNGIMHAGNKAHYTAEVVKMWVEAVYSIK